MAAIAIVPYFKTDIPDTIVDCDTIDGVEAIAI
jgi:hypothetical protein